MRNQNKKTNYRISLEKQFPNAFKPVTVTEEVDGVQVTKELPLNIYKLSESKPAELLTFSSGEVLKARQDMKKLEKMNNQLVKAFDFESKDGKKINVYIPQRLQFLNEEPK